MTSPSVPVAPVAPAPSAARLEWSGEWVVESAAAGTLVLTAGGDRRLAIDGLDDATLATVGRWAATEVVATSDAERRLLDRLVELRVVAAAAGDRAAVALVGEPALVDALAGHLDPLGIAISCGTDAAATAGHPQSPSSAVTLVLRSGPRWPSTPAGATLLGVDLTLHHTVVLGPLVVPGVSACLDCATTRAARRWGTPSVPPTPAVRRSLAVVAALVAVQVEMAADGTSPLVNASIAWDLERGTTDRQTLYKMVGCPTCDAVPSTGRVALPWADEGPQP